MMTELSNLLNAYGPLGVLGAAVLHLLTVWLNARSKRCVRYKTPTLEIEAPTTEEVERLKRGTPSSPDEEQSPI